MNYGFDNDGNPTPVESFDFDSIDGPEIEPGFKPDGEAVLEFLADTLLAGHMDSMPARVAAILVIAGKCSRQEAATRAGVTRRQINRVVKTTMSRVYRGA